MKMPLARRRQTNRPVSRASRAKAAARRAKIWIEDASEGAYRRRHIGQVVLSDFTIFSRLQRRSTNTRPHRITSHCTTHNPGPFWLYLKRRITSTERQAVSKAEDPKFVSETEIEDSVGKFFQSS